MSDVNFYNKFLSLCNSVGKSPSAVAEEAGLHRSQVSRWKNGKGFTDSSAIKIANYFGITLEELIEKPATTGDGQEYVNNDRELTEMLERARDDPYVRMLFSVTKDATPEDIKKAIKIIQTLKGE